MSKLEQVRAAEQAMKKARAAYLTQLAKAAKRKDVMAKGTDTDRVDHRRLLTELKEATDRYFELVFDLSA